MEMTVFLASLWGPAVLAMGLGVLISPNHYVRIYRDIQREPFALLVFGLMGIMLGLWHIGVHNVWGNLTEVIVSIFGWGLLLKAATFVIKPNIVDDWGDWVVSSKMVPAVGVATLIVGGYLTWVAYFM